MQFLLIVASSLSLLTTALANPMPVAESVDEGTYHWHGCGHVGECRSADVCQQDKDCISQAKGHIENIYCGQSNYPTACWASWTD